ncbi:MAG: Fe-S cluster assembly sulfur transfer protein SufU [Cyclobacteriaceae bacterium]
MSGGIKDLYHPMILEHNKHPMHFEKWENASQIIEAYNPVCGDQFKIFLDIKNSQIEKVTFHGYGCALSKAATSILVKLLQKKNLTEARELCHQYLQALEEGYLKPGLPPEFEAFLVAKNFPGRTQCVTLSWEALKNFLAIK